MTKLEEVHELHEQRTQLLMLGEKLWHKKMALDRQEGWLISTAFLGLASGIGMVKDRVSKGLEVAQTTMPPRPRILGGPAKVGGEYPQEAFDGDIPF